MKSSTKVRITSRSIGNGYIRSTMRINHNGHVRNTSNIRRVK